MAALRLLGCIIAFTAIQPTDSQKAAAFANERAGQTVFADQVQAGKSAELEASFGQTLETKVEVATARVCEFDSDAEMRSAMDKAYNVALQQQETLLAQQGGEEKIDPVFTSQEFQAWVRAVLNPKNVPLDDAADVVIRRAAQSLAARNGFTHGSVPIQLPFLHGPVLVKLLRKAAAECVETVAHERVVRARQEVEAAEIEARTLAEMASREQYRQPAVPDAPPAPVAPVLLDENGMPSLEGLRAGGPDL